MFHFPFIFIYGGSLAYRCDSTRCNSDKCSPPQEVSISTKAIRVFTNGQNLPLQAVYAILVLSYGRISFEKTSSSSFLP